MARAHIAWLAAAACAAGCGSPPADGREPLAWSVALSELPAALRGVCAGGGAIVAVGGRDGALALEWTDGRWRAAPLPRDAGRLWWCWLDRDGSGFAVGERGTVLARTGPLAWQRDPTGDAIPTDATLYGVWGTSVDDVHVVGGSFNPGQTRTVAARRTPDGWTAAPVGSVPDAVLFKAWGAAADDVWIVGADGALAHFDGTGWRPFASPTAQRLIAVWGTAGDDVYAVGGDAAGVVLHYDGAAWAPWASTPERLSGVWTAADAPLYVVGDRGYTARIDRATGQRDEAIALRDVDLHAAVGLAGGGVAACGADLLAGGNPSWRGALVTTGADLAGPIDLPDAGAPDAATADAGRPPDAGPAVDAGASADAAALPGEGEPCGPPPDLCRADLTCWGLLTSEVFLCTQECALASECFAYGPDACCAVPGFQTAQRVCIPAGYAECR